MAKAKSTKESNHVLREVLPCKINEHQPSLQRGDGERGRCCIGHFLHFWPDASMKFEVLEIWEKPDEIQDLSARAFGSFESKKSKRRREVSETLLDDWHEARYVKIV